MQPFLSLYSCVHDLQEQNPLQNHQITDTREESASCTLNLNFGLVFLLLFCLVGSFCVVGLVGFFFKGIT